MYVGCHRKLDATVSCLFLQPKRELAPLVAFVMPNKVNLVTEIVARDGPMIIVAKSTSYGYHVFGKPLDPAIFYSALDHSLNVSTELEPRLKDRAFPLDDCQNERPFVIHPDGIWLKRIYGIARRLAPKSVSLLSHHVIDLFVKAGFRSNRHQSR
jgi:hypothetical protein